MAWTGRFGAKDARLSSVPGRQPVLNMQRWLVLSCDLEVLYCHPEYLRCSERRTKELRVI